MNLFSTIEKPTLLLDKARAVRNIDKMVAKAQRSGIHFRPHFKTHQAAGIGQWFRQRGVAAITVSSVDMAAYFAHHGWRDITIAFPVNLRQSKAISALAERVRLNLLVESAESAQRLSQELHTDVNVWLKIDAGYHRTGLAWDDAEAITAVAQAIQQAPRLHWQGVLTHAGQTYRAKSPAEVVAIYQDVLDRLKTAQRTLQRQGLETMISIGDTPGCSLVETFGAVDEVRPGNFIFYDLTQLQIGACSQEEIAVAVACPVVAKHQARQQLILYGGAIHLSKEFLRDPDGRSIYGRLAYPTAKGWTPILDNAFVASVSQEHGVVQADEALFNSVQVGDLLLVLPVHSCLTANLLQKYLTLDGEVIEMARLT
jgi:D-serine deaminase-like pyridoxal phosphate-dependent protein